MEKIRAARTADAVRIAEIEIFNYRLNFYPIFRNDEFYFGELQVPALAQEHLQDETFPGETYVYDDGVVKGFVRTDGTEIKKLFVEPVLHGQGIGAKLLDHAVNNCGAHTLWALEKNVRAIAFYQRHGFRLTGEKMPEEDTTEYLVRMEK